MVLISIFSGLTIGNFNEFWNRVTWCKLLFLKIFAGLCSQKRRANAQKKVSPKISQTRPDVFEEEIRENSV
jgi:hypothetical protein